VLAAGAPSRGLRPEALQQGDEGWHAAFYITGQIHAIFGGQADAPTPWRAVQRAGWDAIQHAERFL
jgi:hypothetical protein